MKNWSDWLIELITHFRNEVEKLLPEQKSKISSLDDFHSPCQADVIWLQNEKMGLDFGLVIFEHFEDRSDLEVLVHGPILFSKAIVEFEEILADEKWGRQLKREDHHFIEDGERTLRRILEGRLVSVLDELRAYVLESAFSEAPLSPMIGRKMWLTNESFTWTARGDIFSVRPADIIAKVVEDAAQGVLRAQPEPVPKPEQMVAYGTYFYPAIWIGEVPKRTFGDKARKKSLGSLPKSSCSLTYKGRQVVVQQDGLVAIATDSKPEALEMLNEIMGTALISGLSCFAIRESEVGDIKIDTGTVAIQGWSMSLVSDRTRLFDMFGGDNHIAIPTSRSIISLDDLSGLLKGAERITIDAEVTKSLVFLLESFTHLQSSEYAQCFVMAWTVVERYISSLWDDFLKDKSIPAKRRKKLARGLLWTTDDIVESLNFAGIIDSQSYNSFMSLKNKRNKILHTGETATREDSGLCFRVALALVRDSVQKLGVVPTIHPQRRILGLRD